jgi:hypothetical protein
MNNRDRNQAHNNMALADKTEYNLKGQLLWLRADGTRRAR